MIDADEKTDRKQTLEGYVSDLIVPNVIAVARPEFEAWLVADWQTAARVTGAVTEQVHAVEDLGRTEAKRQLKQWVAEYAGSSNENALRRDIARQCDLGVVRQSCPAGFGAFART